MALLSIEADLEFEYLRGCCCHKAASLGRGKYGLIILISTTGRMKASELKHSLFR